MTRQRNPESRKREAAICIARAKSRVGAGLCAQCGEPRGDNGTHWTCRLCADRFNALTQARRTAKGRAKEGYCQDCTRPLPEEYTQYRCPQCVERHNADSRKRHRDLIEAECCPKCGKPRLSQHVRLCGVCFFKRAAYIALGSQSHWSSLQELWQAQEGRCAYTQIPLELGLTANIDHKRPRSRFPEDAKDPANIHWVHSAINSMKRTMTHDEFMSLIGHILALAKDNQTTLEDLRAFSEARQQTLERIGQRRRRQHSITPDST